MSKIDKLPLLLHVHFFPPPPPVPPCNSLPNFKSRIAIFFF